MTQTTFAAPDFARATGCSTRNARRWLRRNVASYPEAHVRMDRAQFNAALLLFHEQRFKRAAAQLAARTIAPTKRAPASRLKHAGTIKAAALEAYARLGNAAQAAREVGCSPRTARRWIAETGGDSARTQTKTSRQARRQTQARAQA